MKNDESSKMSCLQLRYGRFLGPIISIQTLLILLWILQFNRTQWKIRRFRMKIIGLKIAHILAMNCNKELIFGQSTIFMMLFPKALSQPIISQIHLFVTSHFSTLFANMSCNEDFEDSTFVGKTYKHASLPSAKVMRGFGFS